MSFFEKIYDQLFGSEKPQTQARQKVPFVTEPLKRTQLDQQFFYRWITEKSYLSVLTLVADSYHQAQLGEPSTLQIRILNEPSAKGFALVYDPMISKQEFKALHDFFKDKVRSQGYRQYVAERKSFDEPNRVRIVEKYYLKPHITEIIEGQPLDQLFGNILIEGHYQGHEPTYIKFMATTYHDRMYQQPKPFADLTKLLFETP